MARQFLHHPYCTHRHLQLTHVLMRLCSDAQMHSRAILHSSWFCLEFYTHGVATWQGSELGKAGAVKALRCQLPRSNPYYSSDPPGKHQKLPVPLQVPPFPQNTSFPVLYGPFHLYNHMLRWGRCWEGCRLPEHSSGCSSPSVVASLCPTPACCPCKMSSSSPSLQSAESFTGAACEAHGSKLASNWQSAPP